MTAQIVRVRVIQPGTANDGVYTLDLSNNVYRCVHRSLREPGDDNLPVAHFKHAKGKDLGIPVLVCGFREYVPVGGYNVYD